MKNISSVFLMTTSCVAVAICTVPGINTVALPFCWVVTSFFLPIEKFGGVFLFVGTGLFFIFIWVFTMLILKVMRKQEKQEIEE
jgi:hypothetical protein